MAKGAAREDAGSLGHLRLMTAPGLGSLKSPRALGWGQTHTLGHRACEESPVSSRWEDRSAEMTVSFQQGRHPEGDRGLVFATQEKPELNGDH